MTLSDMQKVVIETIHTVVLRSSPKIGTCAAYCISCEGWLKVEILDALTHQFGKDDDVEILPEHKHVDLVVTRAKERVWIELKTFPCNYGVSGNPITNSIAGVVTDLEKLGRLVGPTSLGIAVWLAYSIPDETPPGWSAHLRKVESAALRTICSDRIRLWQGHSAHLYIMEALTALETTVM